ncbi:MULTISPECIES: phosphopantetheine-binding protein [Shouchella]|uniref:Phosphopantetheine-binding protein n=2 Tax=Shouchella TaxID=2893057 RepID=A0ABY7W3K0_9BACI|nr:MULTISPECIES: phosphopantetheine-binding protein [Shouchella]MED4128013.1 phosphopantetheine-binding protein [Shouchella miscanthi]WDF03156.1 phosphopantetheine-binding protein [Shouchella hunanensis]GAF21370.1 acyl carrier protein associated with anthrachelin biosynthesis [Bacillus sp. JCM 19047]
MTYEHAVTILYTIIKEDLALQTIDAFHHHARLNEDLAIDSVMILHILLQLETEYAIAIPDEYIDPAIFETVDRLAQFIQRQEETTAIHD